MNTRARVKAIPMIMAASLGLANFDKMIAHENHSRASLQPADLDELNLTIEEAGVTGMPESIEAGRYLVKVTGPEPGEMGPTGVAFVQFPEGVTAESAFEETQANQEEMPSWYLDTHFGGGVMLSQGTESWVVLDFTPGTWVVSTLFGTTLGVEFEVTGDLATDLADPKANVTLELLEMAIRVSDGEFVAGENVVTVVNNGAQIHFVDFGLVPDGTTREQVESLMDSFMTGTPPAEDGLQEDDFVPLTYVVDISPGVSETLPLTLEAGTYFLTCWIPDTESGAPHAMMGMWELITVE